MLKLLRMEWVKLRRSLALLMLVAIPAIVVAFNTLILTRRLDLAKVGAQQVQQFWMMNVSLWAFFMLPLFVALITGLLNGQEHRNQTWRLMLTLPVSPLQLYLVKGSVAWAFAALGSALLVALSTLALLILGWCGADVGAMHGLPMLAIWAKLALACMPMVAIQHAIAWRVSNLVAPLACGVVATMMITQVGSSRHWVWLPWDYPLMAVAGSMPGATEFALVLALCTGVAATLLGALTLARSVRA